MPGVRRKRHPIRRARLIPRAFAPRVRLVLDGAPDIWTDGKPYLDFTIVPVRIPKHLGYFAIKESGVITFEYFSHWGYFGDADIAASMPSNSIAVAVPRVGGAPKIIDESEVGNLEGAQVFRVENRLGFVSRGWNLQEAAFESYQDRVTTTRPGIREEIVIATYSPAELEMYGPRQRNILGRRTGPGDEAPE